MASRHPSSCPDRLHRPRPVGDLFAKPDAPPTNDPPLGADAARPRPRWQSSRWRCCYGAPADACPTAAPHGASFGGHEPMSLAAAQARSTNDAMSTEYTRMWSSALTARCDPSVDIADSEDFAGTFRMGAPLRPSR